MMFIKNMRWGCDDGGMACGPVEPSYMVETLVSDENEHNYFILCSRLCDDYRVDIAEMPLFDLMMYAPLGQAFDYELKKLEKASIEHYNFEKEEAYDPDEYDEDEEIPEGFDLFDCPEMFESRFANAIKLTLAAMEQCWGAENPTDQDARGFMEKYLGKNIDEMDLNL